MDALSSCRLDHSMKVEQGITVCLCMLRKPSCIIRGSFSHRLYLHTELYRVDHPSLHIHTLYVCLTLFNPIGIVTIKGQRSINFSKHISSVTALNKLAKNGFIMGPQIYIFLTQISYCDRPSTVAMLYIPHTDHAASRAQDKLQSACSK